MDDKCTYRGCHGSGKVERWLKGRGKLLVKSDSKSRDSRRSISTKGKCFNVSKGKPYSGSRNCENRRFLFPLCHDPAASPSVHLASRQPAPLHAPMRTH
eukprot:scaffold123405_cov22-Tisochrysis_lutea.AAC.2